MYDSYFNKTIAKSSFCQSAVKMSVFSPSFSLGTILVNTAAEFKNVI
jgi:hypothetical protein